MADPKKSAGRAKKKEKKNIPEGIVYIQSTFNNTIVTIADKKGDVVSWCSSGCLGFKGSRKSTPFAAQKAVAEAAKKAMDQGMRRVEVRVKGPGLPFPIFLPSILTKGVTSQREFVKKDSLLSSSILGSYTPSLYAIPRSPAISRTFFLVTPGSIGRSRDGVKRIPFCIQNRLEVAASVI